MNHVTTAIIQSEMMCSLPNGDLMYSARFTRPAGLPALCSLIKLKNTERKFLAEVGAHLPEVFGSVSGQVCARFQNMNIADGSYMLELHFSDGATLQTVTTYSKSIKSTSQNALKHFDQVGLASDAMKKDGNHSAAATVEPPELQVDPTPLKAPVIPSRQSMNTQPPVPPPPYNYHVDGIIGGVVEGWIWCPHQPDRRYEVQAWCGNRLVGYGVANLYREDLEAKGKADGRIKFELPLTRTLFDGGNHMIQVRVNGQGTFDSNMVLASDLLFEAPSRPQRSEIQELLIGHDDMLSGLRNFIRHYGQDDVVFQSLIQKVIFHSQNGEPKLVRKFVHEVVKASNDHPMLQFKLAEAFLMERKFPEAIACYQASLFDYGKSIHAYLGMAHANRLLGRDEEAFRLYGLVLGIDQHNPVAKKFIESVHPRSSLKSSEQATLEHVDKKPIEQVSPYGSAKAASLVNKAEMDYLSLKPTGTPRASLLGNTENAQVLQKLMELTRNAKAKSK